MKTSAEYVKTSGVVCPVCGAQDMEGDSVEVDAGGAWQDIVCCNCGSSWRDEYVLTGYADLTKGDDPPNP